MIENLLIVECLPKCPKQRVSSCYWSAPSSLRPMTRPDDMVAVSKPESAWPLWAIQP